MPIHIAVHQFFGRRQKIDYPLAKFEVWLYVLPARLSAFYFRFHKSFVLSASARNLYTI